MKEDRVIIAGSRTFDDYELLAATMESFFDVPDWDDDVDPDYWEAVEVVCGGARGADQLGERWAQEVGIDVAYFPADWAQYGKRAGLLRNDQMADYGNILVAFWDFKSSGTRHMIMRAINAGIETHIIPFGEAACE